MSIDIFKQTGARLGARATRPVRDGIAQPAVGGGLDLIGVAAGQAVGTGFQEVITKIANYQAKQDEKEENVRIQNKNSTEAAKLERRIQLQMDKWKEDPNFANWTPEEFNLKWNAFEKQELNNLKNIIFKNDERAFAKFESAYYTIFNNNRRIFRAEKQDKLRLDSLISLNRRKTARYSAPDGLKVESIDSGNVWNWYESELKEIDKDAKVANTIDGTGSQPQIDAEKRLFLKTTFETIFRKGTIFLKNNELYDPESEDFANDKVTDWNKVINYIENEDEYQGKAIPVDMKNELLAWARGEKSKQEQLFKIEKEKRKDAGLASLTKSVLTGFDINNPTAYITEEQIRTDGVNAGLTSTEINSLVRARRDIVENAGKVKDDTLIFQDLLFKITIGEITDGNQILSNDKLVPKYYNLNIISHPDLNTSSKIELLNKISEMKKPKVKEANRLFNLKVKSYDDQVEGKIKTNVGKRRYANYVVNKTIEFNELIFQEIKEGSKKGQRYTVKDLLDQDSEYYIFSDITEFSITQDENINEYIDQTKGTTVSLKKKKPDPKSYADVDGVDRNQDGIFIIKDDNDYLKIPSGSQFIDPDTQEIREKP
tara:strand:+ start:125 stop:1921 length:1797 start_codon:yes stop_codon:yes gene_type:complete